VTSALDKSVLPRQFYLSPGFAKIAPWWLVRRDKFVAKVPVPIAIGIESADGATNVYSLNRRAVSKNEMSGFNWPRTVP